MRIEIMPTLACNLQCEQCDRGHQGNGPIKDIKAIESFDIIQRVFENVAIHDVFEGFVVSGGEPTTYPLLPSLLEFLHGLRGGGKVEIKSNGFSIMSLPLQTVLNNHWSISVYRENISNLIRQMPVLDMLKRVGTVDLSVISYFDDFDNLGDKHTGINPLEYCFMPTIIGNLEKVFPCCRALKIGRKTGSEYSVNLDEFTLERLIEVITKTDMCRHCPRYVGSKKIDRRMDHEKCCSN